MRKNLFDRYEFLFDHWSKICKNVDKNKGRTERTQGRTQDARICERPESQGRKQETGKLVSNMAECCCCQSPDSGNETVEHAKVDSQSSECNIQIDLKYLASNW